MVSYFKSPYRPILVSLLKLYFLSATILGQILFGDLMRIALTTGDYPLVKGDCDE